MGWIRKVERIGQAQIAETRRGGILTNEMLMDETLMDEILMERMMKSWVLKVETLKDGAQTNGILKGRALTALGRYAPGPDRP